jgi:hypothetical protein
MEETMRVLTTNELMRLTRSELCNQGSVERANALISLRNIRYVLARPDFSP